MYIENCFVCYCLWNNCYFIGVDSFYDTLIAINSTSVFDEKHKSFHDKTIICKSLLQIADAYQNTNYISANCSIN